MRVYRRPMMIAVAVLLCLSGLAAACGTGTPAGEPGSVQIDEVSLQILESFPVQVQVLIVGSLHDACTEIDRVERRFEARDSAFHLEIQTVRATDEACAQVLAPFEEVVPLDVYGLPAGTYSVHVDGVRETFTLDVDNVPAEGGAPNPASAYCEEQNCRGEIRTDEEGNQFGVCIFPDGSECDEWAFFRGECEPGD